MKSYILSVTLLILTALNYVKATSDATITESGAEIDSLSNIQEKDNFWCRTCCDKNICSAALRF